MTLCVMDGHHCCCQPQDGIECTRMPEAARLKMAELRRPYEKLIERFEAEADHIENNAEALKKWNWMDNEARCRELSAMYLREFAQSLRCEFYLPDSAAVIEAYKDDWDGK